ncbi:MAG: uracil-DNA glycosylase [Verrucomicrobiales bacterium]|nr:uracil-DNA glycosylase [Verrucomicrobiales bacterium]
MPDPAPVARALHSLWEVLVREKRAGHTHLTISSDSIERLRGIPGQLHSLRTRPAAPVRTQIAPEPAATPISPPPAVAVTATAAPAPAPRVETALPPADRPAPPREIAPEPARRAATPVTPIVPTIEVLTPPPGTKAQQIAWLAQRAEHCEACRSLGTLRDTMVFSTGNPDARLMFIGEAPGFEEERQREPFVGPAGQLLTRIIETMGLRRPEDVYISNIVKFRPIKGDPRFQGQQNRKPETNEMAISAKYVFAEIDVVRPEVIVAVGATAAEGLLHIAGSLASLRGRFHDLKGIPVMVTYHPSYLLRETDKDPVRGKQEKRKVWEDMLLVMERLGMPISDRQRRYFL